MGQVYSTAPMDILQSVEEVVDEGLQLCFSHEDCSSLSDEELLKQSLKSPAAFETLMLRYQKQFTSRIFVMIKNRDEAEDVVQDTFIRIYRFAPKFDEKSGTFRSWALTILFNVVRTKFAKSARHRELFAELTDEHFESLGDGGVHTEEHLTKDEVTRLLALVDAPTAALLTRAFIDGIPYAQIAEEEGTTEGAVKARIHRAKNAVRNAKRE